MSDRLRELAALNAVGALDPQQQAEFDSLISSSAAARAEAAAFDRTSELLAAAAEPVAPSAALRASLLSQVAATPQLSPGDSASDDDSRGMGIPRPRGNEPEGREAEGNEPSAHETDGRETEAREPDAHESRATDPPGGPAESASRRRWLTRPAVILGSAAAALALFFGGTAVGIGIASNSFSVEQATALADLQAAPDAQQAQTVLDDGTSATLIWSLEQRRSAIMIDDLDALPEGETYQLWYIGEDGVVADGTFEAAPEGTTWRVLDGLMSEGDAVGVTIEPEGGSPTPSGDPIIVLGSA
ncbi:anti-sigma factor [Salinibacterium hongtaonis]|uniref:anti-sigma factor n=1 Tax=Homoserinimonas hongtaonis TaxID=2079791 RepID=UPI000D3C271D|nr:anti-sigma factor [Salinibacterium hongtaonis]AWB88397.1 hypothetical protein C2138_01500 [Salinibacterium hongtaonis]